MFGDVVDGFFIIFVKGSDYTVIYFFAELKLFGDEQHIETYVGDDVEIPA